MNTAPRRLVIFGVAAFICVVMLAISLSGVFGPAQNLLSVPLSLVQQGASSVSRAVGEFLNRLASLQETEQRIAQYERAIVNFQSEIVELREIRADYERLSELMEYRGASLDREYQAATVIGRDLTGLLRSITIDRGSRDGISPGMAVVTELGLVGRVLRVSATSAQVQLVNDVGSYVNARLQTTRAEGSIQGTPAGALRMIFIPLGSTVDDGDSVVTSGIGGNLPRGILIGQVTSSRIDDSNLFQEAQVRSLIDFARLEIVLIITDFQAADFGAFPTPTAAPGQ